MTTGGIVPRWEWRGFGAFESAVARIAATPPEGVTGGDETYVVSRDGENTIKVRNGLLDVKRLEQVDDRGLELWRPVMKVPSPILADDLRAVLDALGVTAPPLDHPSYRIDELLRRAVDGEVVRSVPVSKRRTRYAVLGCSAEVTEVVAAGRALRTIAVESADRDLVMAALDELGLDPGVNTSYPRALARVAGLAGPRCAVVDVGTNSVKLHVGERTPTGGWRVLADRAEVVRLGEGLLATGALAPAAIARTCDAVCEMIREARRAGAPDIAAVGTAGLRMAANRDAFVAAVRDRCGVTVEVITGDEEGRLGYLAAIGAARPGPGDRVVVAETGGGSSQFTAGLGGRVLERFSIDLGAVRLTEEFGLDGPVGDDVLARARAAAATALGRVARLPPPDALLGMGGAFTNLAAVRHALAEYDPAVIEGTVLDGGEIDRQIARYRTMAADERRGVVGLQAGRAEVILAGAVIARAILDALGRTSVVGHRPRSSSRPGGGAPPGGVAGVAGDSSGRSAASMSRTSSSLSWEKSRYQRPTPPNDRGTVWQTTSSASARSSSRASGEDTGAATTTSPAPRSRRALTAARSVSPVASPSSTTITVRPRTSGGPPTAPNSSVRRPSSRRSRSRTRPISSSVIRSCRAVPWSITGVPPSAIAPMASSGCTGAPSLRTTRTCSGTPRARATSAATGTPPRGSATTTGRRARNAARSGARRRPASRRSRNTMPRW